MNKQEPGGPLPPEPSAGTAPAAAGTPGTVEQQLEKERQARMLMRDRLRHTEALAAESHALRSAMAQELEKVTADRDRLRAEAATAAAAPPLSATAADAPELLDFPGRAEPSMASASPTKPPAASPIGERPLAPPARRGPWRALAMLGGLAAGVAFLAWLNGSMPSVSELASASKVNVAESTKVAAVAPATAVARAETSSPAASSPLAAETSASAAVASVTPAPAGPVPLPPLDPEARLAAAPTAAGPAPSAAAPATTATAAVPVDLTPRLRKALDGEGISAPVAVDAASGHVIVSDPKPDPAWRDRTDMLIRAVFAGASLPEPQIEHRWLTPKRGEQVSSLSPTTSQQAAAAASTPTPALSPAAAYLARHPFPSSTSTTSTAAHAADRAKKGADVSVADAEELRPVLPAGRLTSACMDGLAGRTTGRRAGLTACMKHSCCSGAANLNSEECRAYTKAYPFTCSAG